MRRDLLLGMILSVLLHGGFAGVGQWLKEGPKLIQKLADVPVEFRPFPPPEPDPPDENSDDLIEEAVKPVLPPPMLPEIPPVANLDAIPQPPVPVPASNLHATGVVTIPREKLIAGGGRIFDISALDQIPRPTLQAQPAYPAAMRTRGVTGTVLVEFVVDTGGRVAGAYAVHSSQKEFEAEAVKAVSGWRFKPGIKGGKPVPTRMAVQIQFTLKG